MNVHQVADCHNALANTRSRTAKVDTLASIMEVADDLPIVAHWICGLLPQGKVGVGFAAVRAALAGLPPSAGPSTYTLSEADTRLTALKAISGKGTKARRHDALVDLLAPCSASERSLLAGLLTGELRQGASVGIVTLAVAKASGVDLPLVRRAALLSGHLPSIVVDALTGGAARLSAYRMEVFRPLSPMLASTTPLPSSGLERLGGEAFIDDKLDGVRLQVHRNGSEVRAFTRQLHDVSRMVPDILATARTFPYERFILDAEAIALDDTGRPRPFQTTMTRFGRKVDVAEAAAAVPLTLMVFDALLLGHDELLDTEATERFERLQQIPATHRVRRSRVTTDEGAQAAYDEAVESGHEGVMMKAVGSTYQAGARGSSWLKLKPVHTLDLLVIAAEWGSGRRKGWLSNLHLAAKGPQGPVLLGKTFKGLTDVLLAWQTEALLALQTHRTDWVVHVRPELVVEVAFNDVQTSPHYPGGVALRFARVRRYRPDKDREEVATIDSIRSLLPK